MSRGSCWMIDLRAGVLRQLFELVHRLERLFAAGVERRDAALLAGFARMVEVAAQQHRPGRQLHQQREMIGRVTRQVKRTTLPSPNTSTSAVAACHLRAFLAPRAERIVLALGLLEIALADQQLRGREFRCLAGVVGMHVADARRCPRLQASSRARQAARRPSWSSLATSGAHVLLACQRACSERPVSQSNIWSPWRIR